MSFLLDTNVVSELIKPRPDPRVTAWLGHIDDGRIFLSVVTLTELRFGAMRLARGRRRTELERWLHDDLRVRFADRIVPIDDDIAIACGDVIAERQAAGQPIETFIAATARTIGLSLVTRNETHFAGSLTYIINPWSDERG